MVPVGAVSLRRDISGCSGGDLITGVVSLRVGLTVVGDSIDARRSGIMGVVGGGSVR
jgi:hypothetical protein